jgi:hypothetical protein
MTKDVLYEFIHYSSKVVHLVTQFLHLSLNLIKKHLGS